ncbi:MAG TPA: hypothetical protein VGE01_07900 [Fimbriimonas sp.]
MKKRSSPILLITILIICLGVVFGMNYKPSKDDGHDHQAEAPKASEGAAPGTPRTNTPSVADLKKQSQAKPTAMRPPNPMSRAKAMGMPDEAVPPSIENPNAGLTVKPKPSDSSIAGQWYADEARK